VSGAMSPRQRGSSRRSGTDSVKENTTVMGSSSDEESAPARRPSFCMSQPLLPQLTNFAVFHYNQVPYYLQSKHILSHYRMNFSSGLAFRSLFHLHNETWNIWTHILGFFLFFGLMIYALSEWLIPPDADSTDRAFFLCFIVAAQIQMSCSFLFHWFCCMSKTAYQRLARMDYIGINVLIIGSKLPILHYILYCHSYERYFWIATISLLGLSCTVVSLLPFFQTPRYQTLRAMLFIGLGLTGAAIFPHAVYVVGSSIIPIVKSLALMGFLYIFGACIYAAHIPERWWPGKFDIWGHSHTIWHVFVIGACYVHYLAVQEAFMWKVSHPCET